VISRSNFRRDESSSVREAFLISDGGGRLRRGTRGLRRVPCSQATPKTSAPVARGLGSLRAHQAALDIESECAALAGRMRPVAGACGGDEQAARDLRVAPRQGRDAIGADSAFHERMPKPGGNRAPTARVMMKTLWEQRTGPRFRRLSHHCETPETGTSRSASTRKIVGSHI